MNDMHLLMNNLLNEVKRKHKYKKIKEVGEKFDGILPKHQIQRLKTYNMKDISETKIDYNNPYKDKKHILKQSVLRENLLSEADFKRIENNKNSSSS